LFMSADGTPPDDSRPSPGLTESRLPAMHGSAQVPQHVGAAPQTSIRGATATEAVAVHATDLALCGKTALWGRMGRGNTALERDNSADEPPLTFRSQPLTLIYQPAVEWESDQSNH